MKIKNILSISWAVHRNTFMETKIVDDRFPQDSLPLFSEGLDPTPEHWPEGEDKSSSAVAFLFLPPLSGQPHARVLLTKRTTTVRTHKGQIGFCGGHRDPEDKSPADTALRETFEEVGIPVADIRVHGQLPMNKSVYGKGIAPIICTATTKEEDFVLSKDEVAQVLTPDWTLFKSGSEESFRFNAFGNWGDSYLYKHQEMNIWGLTAGMLFQGKLT
jgi:8-oxo-dGTP pyrophosphatase MutT (NUDIX family)